MIEIPLTSQPEQLFRITLEGTLYDLRIAVNSRVAFWTISFRVQGNSIVEGVPLLGGIDILKQHSIPIENIYIVNLDNNKNDPSKDNLGTVAKLFILTSEEIEFTESGTSI